MKKLLVFSCLFFLPSSALMSLNLSQNYLAYLDDIRRMLVQDLKQERACSQVNFCVAGGPMPAIPSYLKGSRYDSRVLHVKLRKVVLLRKFISECKKKTRGVNEQTKIFDAVLKKYERRISQIRQDLELLDELSNDEFVLSTVASSERNFEMGASNFPVDLEGFFSEKFIAFSQAIELRQVR